jgi:hypothetical protein
MVSVGVPEIGAETSMLTVKKTQPSEMGRDRVERAIVNGCTADHQASIASPAGKFGQLELSERIRHTVVEIEVKEFDDTPCMPIDYHALWHRKLAVSSRFSSATHTSSIKSLSGGS